jgi:PhnB protein
MPITTSAVRRSPHSTSPATPELATRDDLEHWLCGPRHIAPELDELARAFDVQFEARSTTEADAFSRRLRLTLAVLRDVFPTDAAIRRWLRAPRLELGGERPLDLLLAGRAERLEQCAIHEWNRATHVFTLFRRRLMSVKPIPDGYHTITPAIIVRGAARAIDFYKRAFGAEEIERMDGPEGSIMHAELRIGDSIIMLGDENPQFGTKSPLSVGGTSSSLHVYVDDADAVFARALSAGATVRYPLEDTFWGDRYGKVTDPFGHEWGIATHIKDVSKDDMRKASDEWMAKMRDQSAQGQREKVGT